MLKKFFLKHPWIGITTMLILAFGFSVGCFVSIERAVKLTVHSSNTQGVVTGFSLGTKSSTYHYNYEVKGRILKGSEGVLIPFVFSFDVGDKISVIYNQDNPRISTPEKAIWQDYVIAMISIVITSALWFHTLKSAREKSMEEKVESLDLKKQVAEFERNRQKDLKGEDDRPNGSK